MSLRLISIELTNRCDKACAFCYNHSKPHGATQWKPEEVIMFATDCANHGVEALSLGGGEPLEYEGLLTVLNGLRGVLYRTLTTNGLHLDNAMLRQLAATGIEKVHVSLHFPERNEELEFVIRQVKRLDEQGIRAGVNLLVSGYRLAAASKAARALCNVGIGNDRIIYLPMRLHAPPTPNQVAQVAGQPFQSTACLTRCGFSPRFVSIDWRKQAAWCSYTSAKRPLRTINYKGLIEALNGLGVSYCGQRDHIGQLKEC